MKFNRIALAVLLAAPLMSAHAGIVTVTPLVGMYSAEAPKASKVDDGVYAGLAAGIQPFPAFAVEAEYGKSGDTKLLNADALLKLDGLGISIGSLKPYILAGVAQQDWDYKVGTKKHNSKDTAMNLGAGFVYPINSTLAVRGELRAVDNSDKSLANYLVLAGLQYSFGSLKTNQAAQPTPIPEPAPLPAVYVPADTDGDGVVDANDRCPNTPAGWEVGRDGCPLDSDKDRVPNSIDECPNTPVGMPVGANGCPMDDDKDGVINANDKCPNTPSNELVDETGCTKTVEKVITEKVETKINIVFDSGQAVIKPQFEPEVAKIATMAKDYPSAVITIEGHTDNSGSPAKNKVLSQQRADAVRMMLINKFAVDGARLSSVGYGDTRPVAPNTTAEGKAQNRRVIAVMTAEKKTVEVKPMLKPAKAVKAKAAKGKSGKAGKKATKK